MIVRPPDHPAPLVATRADLDYLMARHRKLKVATVWLAVAALVEMVGVIFAFTLIAPIVAGAVALAFVIVALCVGGAS